MKRFTVLITDSALSDLEKIYNYIAGELLAPSTAREQFLRIQGEILSLDVFPNRIKLMESFRERKLGYRQMYVDNYSVFFYIEKDEVIVFRVLYTPSDIINKLGE